MLGNPRLIGLQHIGTVLDVQFYRRAITKGRREQKGAIGAQQACDRGVQVQRLTVQRRALGLMTQPRASPVR